MYFPIKLGEKVYQLAYSLFRERLTPSIIEKMDRTEIGWKDCYPLRHQSLSG